MKRLVALLSCIALPVLGEAPGGFSSSAQVTPAGGDALQRLALPIETYRVARRDLADVRVLNGRGEPVPIAIAGEAEVAPEAPRSIPVPHFPVTSLAPSRTGGAQVTVRTQDGTLVAVHGRGGANPAVPVAYLLDASQAKEPLRALVFDWQPGPGTQVVRISVEAGDDLQSWHGVARTSLVRVAESGRVLEQPRVLFAATRGRYFRVTWSGPAFALRGVRAEFEPDVKRPERSKLVIAANANPKAGEFVYDLGAQLPVEAVRIVPAEPNSVATFALSTRDVSGGDWRGVDSGVFYRLVRDGAEVESPPLEVGRRAAREWRARADPQAAGMGNAAPTLEVHWRSAQVVFVARGPAPFRLAFGDPDAKSAWVPVASLIPGYRRGEEMKLAQAAVGPVEGRIARQSVWPEWLSEMGPRKLTLWAILAGAVAMLGFMAWRLQRQLRAPRDDSRQPPA